ncbi:hypothetical protein ABL78_0333 [Leptomonas seymouri]|uniref:Uncharacterized protein n=1 Tax=Leptomonas seymouri TaxID=5684 RepID=A0A0N1IAG5_LEPSE|nr:hypothetical protein ABL78_0333 [Leptomonas seymouri]|eukprot:KPI90573.1 hypothetical protein ABL78_0333 [Leptomonas seymouri]
MHYTSESPDDALQEPSHKVGTSQKHSVNCSDDTSPASFTPSSHDLVLTESSNPVISYFRHLLTQSDDEVPTDAKDLSGTGTQRQLQRRHEGAGAATSARATPSHRARRHRLQVAIVGESESGRTTLCNSLEGAAEHRTCNPLVVSGQAATLDMSTSVLSVQTYDVPHGESADTPGDEVLPRSPLRGRKDVLEVTVVDSGPAPLSKGSGTAAVMAADVILLCFPLYRIKQVVPLQNKGSLGLLRSAMPTEAFIHMRDVQLLTKLLVLLSSRCDVASSAQSSTLPSLFLVGTFHDVLKDTTVAATHTILRALQSICDRAQQRSPSILAVMDVFAVSATQATAVLLASGKQVALRNVWCLLLQRAAALQAPRGPSATAVSLNRRRPSHEPFISLSALCHLLGHPNRLQTLSSGMRQINNSNGSPCLLDVSGYTALGSSECQKVASEEMIAEDARVTSLVVDFISQLKARKRVWMLPLPKLWCVAYALGMQTREQLYLVLRQMEAAGEVSLLGRALCYTQESLLGACGVTNETVCLCPALTQVSYSILYVYVDWMANRERRHLQRCLRNVELDSCALRDPKKLAARGTFPLPLLRCLAVALGLKKSSPSEAAELLIAALVGSDVAYLAHDCSSDASSAHPLRGTSFIAPSAFPRDALQPPLLSSSVSPPSSARSRGVEGLSSTREAITTSPLPLHTIVLSPASADSSATRSAPGTASPASTTADGAPSFTPSAADPLTDAEYRSGFSPSSTVAQLTSLFLLGELTSCVATSPSAPSSVPSQSASQRANRSARAAPHLTSADDCVVLVVPSLQPSVLCPDVITRHVLACASRTESCASSAQALRSSIVLLRIDPFPYDLIALLTCRVASVALRVERSYSNAVLLSFDIAQLFCPSTDDAPLFQRKGGPATKLTADGCCFLFCVPPPEDTDSCSTVLHLVCFADSAVRVARLEFALCTELRMFLLQRLSGVAVAQEYAAEYMEGSTGGCATVADLIRSLDDVA